jgi:hypothetical protein
MHQYFIITVAISHQFLSELIGAFSCLSDSKLSSILPGVNDEWLPTFLSEETILTYIVV